MLADNQTVTQLYSDSTRSFNHSTHKYLLLGTGDAAVEKTDEEFERNTDKVITA